MKWVSRLNFSFLPSTVRATSLALLALVGYWFPWSSPRSPFGWSAPRVRTESRHIVVPNVPHWDRSGFFSCWIVPERDSSCDCDGEPSHLNLEKELDPFFSNWSLAAPCGVVGLYHSYLHTQLVMRETTDWHFLLIVSSWDFGHYSLDKFISDIITTCCVGNPPHVNGVELNPNWNWNWLICCSVVHYNLAFRLPGCTQQIWYWELALGQVVLVCYVFYCV